jgi:hypothetical protein
MKKTLQEQYLLIKEGKGHKDVFIKEAKRLFPNMVRNAATFKEASDVLKSKQIIKENIVEIGSINQIPSTKKESYELAFEKFLTEEKKKEYFDEEKAELKKPSKQVEDDLSHIYDAKNPDNINNVMFGQVMMGYYAEMKDPKNKDKTADQLKAIVLKNLAKNPIYYTEKGQFGDLDLGYTMDAPGLGEPKEPKGKHKSSGYGDLNEGHKGSCKTAHPDMSHDEYETSLKEMIDPKSQDWKDYDELLSKFNSSKDPSERKMLVRSLNVFRKKWGIKPLTFDKSFINRSNESLEETQVRKVVKEIIRQELNENVSKRLQEIEKESQYEVLNTKAAKIQQEIEVREARLNRLNEDDDFADLLDKNKIKNLKKEIKVLQKAANKVGKILDKVNKKKDKSNEPKEEIVDETTSVEEDITKSTKDAAKAGGELAKSYEKALDHSKELDKIMEKDESELSQYTMEAEEIMAETGDMDEALKTIPEEYKEDVKRHLEPRF